MTTLGSATTSETPTPRYRTPKNPEAGTISVNSTRAPHVGGTGSPCLRYSTVVADPPWHYDGFPGTEATGVDKRILQGRSRQRPMPYPSMSLEEISALPLSELAARDCRLFLWATSRYLEAAFDVLREWGFTYRQTLVWVKPGVPPFGGSVARNFSEFLLVATVGSPKRLSVANSSVITASKSKAQHSRKPEAFLDLVESVSPGPYLEMFARRARFGWDYWGDESLETVELTA